MYAFLVYLHVLSAIGAIGPFFLLLPLLRKLGRAEQAALQLHLDSFRTAVWISKHTGHILVTTGVLLMWLGGLSWGTTWIVATIVILVSSLYFIARAFSPVIRQLRRPELAPEERAPYVTKLSRALYLYLALLLIMLGLMVGKPSFW